MLGRASSLVMLSLLLAGLFPASRQLPTQFAILNPQRAFAHAVSAYENVTTHEGNLIINGTQTFTVENCTYIQSGNIRIRDYAKLILKNSRLILNQGFGFQYSLTVGNFASLSSENVTICSNFYYWQLFYDESFINFTNTRWTGEEFDFGQVAWTYGEGASFLVFQNCSGLGGIGVYATMHFLNSSIEGTGSILARAGSTVFIENSNTTFASIETRSSDVITDRLRGGYVSSFNTFANLTVSGGSAANLTVINSYLDFVLEPYESNVTIGNSVFLGLNAWDSKILISNCSDYTNAGLTVHVSHCEVAVYDSALYDLTCRGNSSFALHNCTVYALSFFDALFNGLCAESKIDSIYLRFSDGTLAVSNATVGLEGGYLDLRDSQLYVSGNISFPGAANIEDWKNSNVTRNFNVISMNRTSPLENATLRLYNRNDTMVWNGTTDNLGKTSFNVTFSDVNCTDALRLEAIEGDWAATMSLTLLSDTPIVFTIPPKPPVASFFLVPETPWIKESIIFDASTSYDPEGNMTEYEWNFGDGNITALSTPVVGHVYSRAGKYVVTLNVTNNYGLWNATSSEILVTFDTDLNKDGLVNIQDVAIVAVACGSKLGDPRWNVIADMDKNEEINRADVITVVNDYGRRV